MSASKARKERKDIVVVIDMLASASARDVMSGIFKFVGAGRPWALRLVQLPIESLSATFADRFAEEVDGMIVTSEADEESNRLIAESDVPTVFVDVRNPLFEQRTRNVSFVRNDNEGIGTAGAEYLASLGKFNSFGFVPDTEQRAWSVLRENAFVAKLAALGARPHVFSGGSRQMAKDRANLIAWLRRLPKPAALMAAYDLRATHVMEACAEAGIGVPEQVAVIGVDDDELLCLATTPHLSSVRADHVAEGFQAAVELDRLFRLGARARRREMSCSVLGVVERESTKHGPPAATLIRRAIAFIDANARTNLRVEAVADGLGVSRRLIERRFREARGESLHDYILKRRMATVKHLLRSTDRTGAKIAAECGFPNANSLSHIFARAVGCSMRAYRASGGRLAARDQEPDPADASKP